MTPLDLRRTLRLFRVLVARGLAYGAAGVWLDVWAIRCACMRSESWRLANQAGLAELDQAGAAASDFLRRMTRILRADKLVTTPADGMLIEPKSRDCRRLALAEIACQATSSIVQCAPTPELVEEAIEALRIALDDEHGELIGKWLRPGGGA